MAYIATLGITQNGIWIILLINETSEHNFHHQQVTMAMGYYIVYVVSFLSTCTQCHAFLLTPSFLCIKSKDYVDQFKTTISTNKTSPKLLNAWRTCSQKHY